MRGEIDLWMYVTTDTLYHHGIKGQRWGVRRFQNENGSLTSKGKDRYDNKGQPIKKSSKTSPKQTTSKQDQTSKSDKPKINKKKVAIGAAVVAGSALAAYGAVKYKKVSGAKSAQTAHKVGEAVKVASATKSATKPIMSFSGKDTGFTQADMDRMLDNLGKMSEIARNGQDVLRNL